MSPLGVCHQLILRFASQLLAVSDDLGVEATELLWDSGHGVWGRDGETIREKATLASEEWLKGHIWELVNTLGSRAVDHWLRNVRSPSYLKSALEGAGVALRLMRHENTQQGAPPELKAALRDIAECKGSELDRELGYLGSPSGVIELASGRIVPPKDARELLITHTIPDPYNPKATHPAIDKLFDHLDAAESGWLLDSVGFALKGYAARRMLLLVGEGGSGKSTLLGAIIAALGCGDDQYAAVMSEGALSGQKNVSAGLNPEMAVFQLPRRLVLAGEESALSNVGRVKTLTGSDPISVRKPHQTAKTAPTTATLVQAINPTMLPNLHLEDRAMFDRLRTLPYPALPEDRRDPALARIVTEDPKARQAMAALLVRHAVKNPDPPADIPSVAGLRESIRRETVGSELTDWLDSAIDRTGRESDFLSSSEAWNRARSAAGYPDAPRAWGLTMKTFLQRMRGYLELPLARPTRHPQTGQLMRGWRGLKLRAEDEVDTNQEEKSEPQSEVSEPAPIRVCISCERVWSKGDLSYTAESDVCQCVTDREVCDELTRQKLMQGLGIDKPQPGSGHQRVMDGMRGRVH